MNENIAWLAIEIALRRELLQRRKECDQLQAEIVLLRGALEAYDPPMPPALEGETPGQYTDRLTGADKTGRVPYSERRNRQCSIGYHDECTDPDGVRCKCPCHQFERLRVDALANTPLAAEQAERVRKLEQIAEWVREIDHHLKQGTIQGMEKCGESCPWCQLIEQGRMNNSVRKHILIKSLRQTLDALGQKEETNG